MSRTVIDHNLRVKLPEELRHAEGFKPGTEVEVTSSNGTVHIKAVQKEPLPPLEWFFGKFPGLSSDFSKERETEWRN